MSRSSLALLLTPIVIFLAMVTYERYEMYRLLTYSGELAADIQRQLHKDSTITDVEAFLQAKGISEWSTLDLTNYNGVDLELRGDLPEVEKAKVKYDTAAIKRDYYNILVLRFSILLRFYLDKDQRLLSSHIHQSSIGIPPPWGFLLPNWPRCPASAICTGLIPIADS